MTNTFVTGFKVIILNLVAGFFTWIMSLLFMLIGITGSVFAQEGKLQIVTWVIIIIFLMLVVMINGWLAQKMWKWD